MKVDEEDLIHEVKEVFYSDLCIAVAKAMRAVPRELHTELLARLQESCSVYSAAP